MKPLLVFLLLILTVQSHALWDHFAMKNRFGLSAEWQWAKDSPTLQASWVPELSFGMDLGKKYSMQAEYSADARLTASWPDDESRLDHKLEHYRWWLGLNRKNTQLRAGLQRLSFGTAQILRPLQWFDRIDPLDANQSTKGFHALLGRHYFANNANIWLWGIYADGDPKGIELIPSHTSSIEAGGRLQYPIPRGEIGLTLHRRNAHPEGSIEHPMETRVGLDARLDNVIGLWTEGMYSRMQSYDAMDETHILSATLGMDYTIGIGNGIYLLAESNLSYLEQAEHFKARNPHFVSALMLTYPLGLLDNFTLLNYYNHQDGKSLHALLFRRAYDYLSIELGLIHDLGQSFGGRDNRSIKLNLYYNI